MKSAKGYGKKGIKETVEENVGQAREILQQCVCLTHSFLPPTYFSLPHLLLLSLSLPFPFVQINLAL